MIKIANVTGIAIMLQTRNSLAMPVAFGTMPVVSINTGQRSHFVPFLPQLTGDPGDPQVIRAIDFSNVES